jgi:hypothetical protein
MSDRESGRDLMRGSETEIESQLIVFSLSADLTPRG